jgi:hypothetical protein
MESTGDDGHAGWRDRAWVWLGERAGRWDYRRRPDWRNAWGGPFNGQEFRQRLFAELCVRIGFAAIIETGTLRGTTTAHFRRTTPLPIHSFESRPRYYGFARAHLRSLPDLHLHRCDSRTGLVRLAAAKVLPSGPVFFYLDAHGPRSLPLAEEIALAFGHWPAAVLMIDDFAVPDDPGYGFDDYGVGKALTLDYLYAHDVLPPGIWFPRCPSGLETGARRGCVVLARSADLAQRIDLVTTLRRWDREDPSG